ncbi:MAG: Ig-like domain-containing protein [Lachnospiraceae bacterium]|nr:Ig-like domain-containing protein [Lachnospiraceae bacterium]
MKKMARRILLMTMFLIMAMSVHAMADYRLYSAKTITLPNKYGGGWSNQFTLPVRSNVLISVNISGNNQSTYINNGLQYVLQNVSSGQKVYLGIPTADKNKLNYTLGAVMNAGTYSFGVYYKGNQSFKLRFSVAGAGGINVPDSLEVMKGTTEKVNVKRADGGTNYIKIKSAKSSQPGYATVTYSNSTTPPSITVKGVATNGDTGSNPPVIITVTGQDGSTDTMRVKITKYVPAPTLNTKSYTLSAGDKVYNAVENAVSDVKWTSSNTKVAKVNQKGRIKAIGYGKCVIRAKTVSNKKTYDLACTVKVTRTSPNFRAWTAKYYPKKKVIKIKVKNLSKVPMVFYSKNGALLDISTEKRVRKTKLRNGSTVTIPKGKTKAIYIKHKGAKLNPADLTKYIARLYFKQDKRYYYAWVFKKADMGVYAWKKALNMRYATYSKE